MTVSPTTPPPGDALLRVANVTVRFGGIVALRGVSFDVPAGRIVGLIGPNGAGKTTLFNCLSRHYRPDEGDIAFGGSSILRLPAHRMAGLGIGRTFQNLALFQGMSVLDNIKVGVHARSGGELLSHALRLPWTRREERASEAAARELAALLELEDVLSHPAQGLPFGTLKRVELARALACRPRLLLLDEPASGLSHGEVEALGGVIRTIRERFGITVLLVEHHVHLVMQVSDRVVVLDLGEKIAEGSPAEIQADARVIRAYLGGGEE